MKRFLITFAMIAAIAFQASAMSYEQARERALFLTDKMAYELNLNDQQYEAAYEVNLDYLMSINTYDDLYGTYWTRRNLDLSYILFDWQYSAFCSAAYFYRPLVWADGVWRFSIYSRYPHRSYFYFGRPDFYLSYRGGHSWHMNGDRSWYHGRTFGHRPGNDNFGMRDRFDRGDFRGTRNHGQSGNINPGRNNNRGNGNFNRGNGNYNGNNGNYNGNNGGFNRNDNGQMNRTDNNGRRNNGTFSGNRNNSGAGNGSTGGRNWNRGNSSNNGGFTTIRPNGSAAQRSSTRTTAERMSTTDNTATATHHEQTMGEGFSRGSSTRPSQTFTPSRSSSSRSSMSTSRSNMSSGSMSHSSSPSRGMSTSRSSVSSSMPSHSSGASHGGGFSSGGGRSGGGGHFGGRR